MWEKILGLPILASAQGAEIDSMIGWVHVLMLVLFIGWGIFFTVTLMKFRRSRNPRADYVGVKNHISSYLEIAVAVIEAVLLLGLSIPFWARQVSALPTTKDVLEVRVVAEQFAWNIHYPGPDGVFGKTAPQFIDKQSNIVGIDPNDPNGKDDFVTINQLHLPVGKTALIYLTSKDVIHCFALPVMRVKQDVIPGMKIPVWFTPTKTGDFEIACAQLCGLGHYRMRGYLIIETFEKFTAWSEKQAAEAQATANQDDFWN